MLQKPKKIIIFGGIGIFLTILVISSGELNSCGIQHVTLLKDIETFEKNGDPEFCERTVNKILEFNEQCKPYIEILDCG
ncbi:MAG TPA: hypothetical protein VLA01_00910 [Nitrosopumilaceae archaeon]|nr:hypothetical protein [Nitrosopumilaceae archaeon]